MNLLFVYNANSGKLNALFDAGHKLFSPSTYNCSLCALTSDTFTENKIWKNFRSESHLEMEFYHKDEFEKNFSDVKITYPIILKQEGNELITVLTSELLNELGNVGDLIKQLKSRL